MALSYVSDTDPGYRRRRCGRGFTYLDTDGRRLAKAETRARLKALAVPPAYTEVWYCPDPKGHLQASGRDARGRKQYIYHPDWVARRAELKFAQLPAFGAALPRLRRWVASRLRGDPSDRDTAVAAVLALLDRASIRVGDPAYAAENESFGATTLQPRHVTISEGRIMLHFAGKGGRKIRTQLTGTRLAKVLESCQDLPGAELVTFAESGAPVRSEHLREVMSDLAGEDLTPKTFRTWNGTHAAYCAAHDGAAQISDLANAAAERLHNTPAVARTSYVHPKVIALAGADAALPEPDPAPGDGWRVGEPELLRLLNG
ncbi:DNA topoisomerase IB [Tropicimonas aquimaris]|uniref:DNA topoisomerase n=1 Tax=Tropicimonas aquimaris TaxID=914152 RepID=A0ABW3IXU6_9RHOB